MGLTVKKKVAGKIMTVSGIFLVPSAKGGRAHIIYWQILAV